MEEIFKQLNINTDQYFLTGSRALDSDSLKISEEQSDYDYVVMITNRHLIVDYLTKNNIQIDYSCYNGGFKFVSDNKTYNIITTIEVEFMAWRESLEILKLLLLKDVKYQTAIKNKRSRYCLYESLRAFIKTTIRFGEQNA